MSKQHLARYGCFRSGVGSKGDRSLHNTFCPWLLYFPTLLQCRCAAAATAEWDPELHSVLSPATGADIITLKRRKLVKCILIAQSSVQILCTSYAKCLEFFVICWFQITFIT